MNAPGRPVLRVGDRVLFEDRSVTVVGYEGTRVRLAGEGGAAQVVLLAHLLASPGFELLDAAAPVSRVEPAGLIDALPAQVLAQARQWQAHVVEVETGLPPDAPASARPAPPYDPALHTLAERDAAKAVELTAAGTQTSAGTVKRMRLRYRAEGLWGWVDQRLVRSSSPFGRVDARVVAAVATAMQGETQRSTGTRGRLRRRVEQLLAAEHGAGVVPVPPSTTFYRLVAAMDAGRPPSVRRPPAARRRIARIGRSPERSRSVRARSCRPTPRRWT